MGEWVAETVERCLERLSLSSLPKLQTRDYQATGRYPIIDQGQGLIAGWTDDRRGLISTNLPVVVFGDHTRAFKYVDFPFVRGADGTQVLKPRAGIDPLFFYYACRAIDLPGRGYNRHFTILKEKTIPTPPFQEQSEIGMALRRVEDAVEVQTQQLRVTQELKHATMHELFTRGLRGEAQKETEIGLVPQSWRVGKLCDFAQFQRGFDITKTAQVAGMVPVVSSGGVKSYHNEAAVSGPGVLIGRKGSIGSLHYVDSDFWPHDTTLWCSDFRGNFPKFVFYRLHVLNLKKLDSGATNPALNRNFLHDEPISWPQIDEQQEITALLDAIDRMIGLHQKKRAVLDDLFKALLQKLITGEIRVDDLDLSALAPPRAEAST